jgi:hypothetical protein
MKDPRRSTHERVPVWGWLGLLGLRLAAVAWWVWPVVLIVAFVWWWTHGGVQHAPTIVREAVRHVQAAFDSLRSH